VRRWLLNLLATTSLILSLALLFVWSWSKLSPEVSAYFESADRCRVAFVDDGCGVFKIKSHDPYSDWWNADALYEHGASLFSVGYRHVSLPNGDYEWTFFGPLWMPAILMLILPALRGIRVVSNRYRRVHHLCLNCGYDLRATPDRCPECGTLTGAATSMPPPAARM
jgi:hypothetical protein